MASPVIPKGLLMQNHDYLQGYDFAPGVKKNPKKKQVGGEHYKTMVIQPSEFIVKNGLGWYEGNAVKYICRHRVKGGKQDLEKAKHYIELALNDYE